MTDFINRILLLLFFVCYFYQFAYIAAALLPRPSRKQTSGQGHGQPPSRLPASPDTDGIPRVCVLIAARNEERVIGELLDSVAAQDYPGSRLTVLLGADRCTDRTAEIARAHGAVVYERNPETDPGCESRQGKGYVLRFLIDAAHRDFGKSAFDGFLILDADNLLEPDFVSRITETARQGYDAVTCYRNSKNYGDNWISAGYALWFLREARYLNAARMRIGSGCAVSGTGFYVSQHALDLCGGGTWNWFLLTEDIEFTVHSTIRGLRIGYCPDAVLYDEQPTRFLQSWTQRMRWSRGYLQVIGAYGGRLLRGMFTGGRDTPRAERGRVRFSCYDMTMNILPAAVLSVIGIVNNLGALVLLRLGNVHGIGRGAVLRSAGRTFGGFLGTLFFFGVLTAISERKQIRASAGRIFLSVLTFPLFMATYLPICIASLFRNPGWKPIRHDRSMNLTELRNAGTRRKSMSGDRVSGDRVSGDRVSGDKMSGDDDPNDKAQHDGSRSRSKIPLRGFLDMRRLP